MKVAPAILLLSALAAPALAGKAVHREPGDTFREGRAVPEMIVIPAGRILEGSSDAETVREARAPALAAFEHPQRAVVFDKPFAVGKYHVTRAEYAVFAKATKRGVAGCVVAVGGKWSDGPQPGFDYTKPGYRQEGNAPVVCVSWDDAVAYTAWLSARTHATYRLLTEAKWEYAARGGTTTARWWGDDAATICARVNGGDRAFAAVMPDDKTANTACSDGFANTSPVDRFAPNPFGLYDMLGNAWQWTADCFTPAAGAVVPDGPCKGRSIRGGSWHNGVSSLRAAARLSLPPTMRASSLGFRVTRELP